MITRALFMWPLSMQEEFPPEPLHQKDKIVTERRLAPKGRETAGLEEKPETVAMNQAMGSTWVSLTLGTLSSQV